MDQVKTGKYIDSLRRHAGITHEESGGKTGITKNDFTPGKWKLYAIGFLGEYEIAFNCIELDVDRL